MDFSFPPDEEIRIHTAIHSLDVDVSTKLELVPVQEKVTSVLGNLEFGGNLNFSQLKRRHIP